MKQQKSKTSTEIIDILEYIYNRYLDYIEALHVYLFFPTETTGQNENLAKLEREIQAVPVLAPGTEQYSNAISIISAILEKAVSEARSIQRQVDQGSPLSRGEYERLMHSQINLLRSIKRIERAMMQASSDLDALTGLHNRQALNRDLERERSRAERTGKAFSIALADLDHFKAINDRYGHKAGDIVLATAAEIFLNAIRPYDIVYRYGGEEFLIYLHDAPPPVAAAILNRLLGKLREYPIKISDDQEITVTSSFGVAGGGRELTLSEIIERADQALYRAKAEGRCRVCVYTEETT